MTLYEVRGGGVASRIWAWTEEGARRAFATATGVHPSNITVAVLQQGAGR